MACGPARGNHRLVGTAGAVESGSGEKAEHRLSLADPQPRRHVRSTARRDHPGTRPRSRHEYRSGLACRDDPRERSGADLRYVVDEIFAGLGTGVHMGAVMAEILDLLVELSPSLKAGWILWLASGMGLAAWGWLARRDEMQPAGAAEPGQSMLFPLGLKSLAEPEDRPAASSAAPASTSESGFRPGRSSRSLRRKS